MLRFQSVMELGHLFTELEDIEWTFWGQWADFAEK
jgi:hypothetical protein